MPVPPGDDQSSYKCSRLNLPTFFREYSPGDSKHTSGGAFPGLNCILSPPCDPQPNSPLYFDFLSPNHYTGRNITTLTNHNSTLKIGCLNLRGFKSCKQYLYHLLNNLDICAVSEHWLHQYEVNLLYKFHPNFSCFATAPHTEEDPVYCAPRLPKGHGGVAFYLAEKP